MACESVLEAGDELSKLRLPSDERAACLRLRRECGRVEI
jgi:hypothetical protein